MYGYFTSYSFVGFVEGRKMFFATDAEYYEYLKEVEHES